MYLAGGEHPHREAARRLLLRIGQREVKGVTSVEVLQEILHRYSAIDRLAGGYEVYASVVGICPEVLPVTLADTDRARNLLSETGGLSARAAIHAAVMLNHGIEWIATFDDRFDGIPGIRRLPLP